MRHLLALVLFACAASASAAPERIDVFEAGKGGYAHYRIPGIVVTPGGSILAYCEARASLAGDWGRSDLLVRRSADGGTTWNAARVLAPPPKDAVKNPAAAEQKIGAAGEITMNNPVAISDGPGGKSTHLLYCVEYNRCFYMRSDDDGVTFSEPREITGVFESMRARYPWRVIATGPGHGIRHTKSGRLIVPVWLSLGEGKSAHRPSCVATIYSDDAGETWQAGDIVVNHPPIDPSESTVAELSDGRVMLNVRHEGDPSGPRGESGTTSAAVFISPDGARGWSPPRLDRALPDPICMASLLRVDGKRLLFVNPANDKTRQRKNLTVRASEDDGDTWRILRVIDSGTSGYSDLASSPDGTSIYCLYERGSATDTPRPRGVGALTFVRFAPESGAKP